MGEYQLWIAVLQDAIETLQAEDGKGAGAARSFIFESNLFFESVCFGLEVSPEVVRDRVRNMTCKHGMINVSNPRQSRIESTFLP